MITKEMAIRLALESIKKKMDEDPIQFLKDIQQRAKTGEWGPALQELVEFQQEQSEKEPR